MLRTLARLLPWSLLVGAVANVVVAWACALAVTPDGLRYRDLGFMVRGSRQDGADVAIGYRSSASKPGLQLVRVHRFGRPSTSILLDRRGWPWPCLGSRYAAALPGPERAMATSLPPFPALSEASFARPYDLTGVGLFCADLPALERALPLEPAWGGVILNTLGFSGVFAVIVLAAGGARRLVRARRRRCPACGYPLGASPVCTECGRETASKPRRLEISP